MGLQQLASFAHAGRTLLGPVKAPKFVVDEEGHESVLVSSTVRLLERLDLTSAVGQLLREAVRAQNDAYGTGASTLLSLAGAWSSAAAECLHLGVPVPAIVAGMSEGLAACMEEVAALQVPLHTVCDQTDSTQTPSGPGPLGVRGGPFPPPPSEAGLMRKERGLHDAASQPSTTSSFSGAPVKSATLSRPQTTAGTDNDPTQTAPTPRTSLRAAPRCRRPALIHSRHCCRAGGAPGTASGPGGVLERRAVPPRAHTCKDLVELAAGLSHGDASSMTLAEAALRLQRQQASVRQGGRAVPLTFDVSRVFTCCLPGLPEAASCVCAGFVTAVSAAGTPVPEDVQNRPLRVVLIEGDLTENYRHLGFNKPARVKTVAESAETLRQGSAEELWADRVLQVLARFRVHLVLAQGSVSERLVGRCARSQRLLIGWVDGRVMQAFAEASGAVQVAYVTQVNEAAVGSGVCVAFWSGPSGGAGGGGRQKGDRVESGRGEFGHRGAHRPRGCTGANQRRQVLGLRPPSAPRSARANGFPRRGRRGVFVSRPPAGSRGAACHRRRPRAFRRAAHRCPEAGLVPRAAQTGRASRPGQRVAPVPLDPRAERCQPHVGVGSRDLHSAPRAERRGLGRPVVLRLERVQ